MTRAKLNRIIDMVAFLGLIPLLTTGLLLRYLLPPGSGGLQGMGTGHEAATKPITLLWGLTRHAWGSLHFWVAVGLMMVLTVHLMLHWRWIVHAIRGRPRPGSGIRSGLGLIGALALLSVILAPWFSPLVQVPRSHIGSQDTMPITPRQSPGDEMAYGRMTLGEIAYVTGIPVTVFLQRLGLPHGVSADARLGRLRQTYGFTIHDVRRIVAEFRTP